MIDRLQFPWLTASIVREGRLAKFKVYERLVPKLRIKFRSVFVKIQIWKKLIIGRVRAAEERFGVISRLGRNKTSCLEYFRQRQKGNLSIKLIFSCKCFIANFSTNKFLFLQLLIIGQILFVFVSNINIWSYCLFVKFEKIVLLQKKFS